MCLRFLIQGGIDEVQDFNSWAALVFSTGIDFNDLWNLDLQTGRWTLVASVGNHLAPTRLGCTGGTLDYIAGKMRAFGMPLLICMLFLCHDHPYHSMCTFAFRWARRYNLLQQRLVVRFERIFQKFFLQSLVVCLYCPHCLYFQSFAHV